MLTSQPTGDYNEYPQHIQGEWINKTRIVYQANLNFKNAGVYLD
jgi:predicted transcriptional regulator